MARDRLKKLAESIDSLPEKDGQSIQLAHTIFMLRRQAAVELYETCAAFTREVNALLSSARLILDPADYGPQAFQENRTNLFQINTQGRILQIDFSATPELTSTEEFRVPYTLEGSVRCFNQQLLEQDLIEEQLLFYCIEKDRNVWRYFDVRTYRTGKFDQDYLISLMERLV